MKKKKNMSHGFKVPENYFEHLEKQIIGNTPMASLSKRSGFTVPEGYFDKLEEDIFSKTISEKKTKVVPLFSRERMLWAASIAACALLVFGIFAKNNSIDKQINNLELTEISNYLNVENVDMSSREIAQYLDTDEIQDLSFSDTYFNADNLEDYLLQNVDESILIQE